MTRDYSISFWIWWDTDHVWTCIEEIGRFVILKLPNSDLSFCKTNRDFIVTIGWPAQTSDRWVLRELITDGLAFSPISTQLIDKHNIITLGYGKSHRVRRESHSSYDIRFLSLFGWFGGEFVAFLSSFVIKVDNLFEIWMRKKSKKLTRSAVAMANFLELALHAIAAIFCIPSTGCIILRQYLIFMGSSSRFKFNNNKWGSLLILFSFSQL